MIWSAHNEPRERRQFVIHLSWCMDTDSGCFLLPDAMCQIRQPGAQHNGAEGEGAPNLRVTAIWLSTGQ